MISCGIRSWFLHTPVTFYAWASQADHISIDVSSLITRRQKVIGEWWYFFVLINQAAWKTSKQLLKFTASVKFTKTKVEVAEYCRILKISLQYSEHSWKLFSAEHEQCSIQSNYLQWSKLDLPKFPTVKDCGAFEMTWNHEGTIIKIRYV